MALKLHGAKFELTRSYRSHKTWIDDKKKIVNIITELFTSASLRHASKGAVMPKMGGFGDRCLMSEAPASTKNKPSSKDLNSDISSEMVEQLELADQTVVSIAELIDLLLNLIIPVGNLAFQLSIWFLQLEDDLQERNNIALRKNIILSL
ncbi:hypothetical protein V6N13_126731 [Hibiscus sabdariffa]|uniref:Uncharacterized protein n=1 Tax=Hibiscus sabdariffa TaxID=183260 RepID=A0ABR2REP8_9ROSI